MFHVTFLWTRGKRRLTSHDLVGYSKILNFFLYLSIKDKCHGWTNRVGSQKEGHERATEPWLKEWATARVIHSTKILMFKHQANGDPQAVRTALLTDECMTFSAGSPLCNLQRFPLGSKLFPDTRLFWVCRNRGAGINNPFHQGHSQHYPQRLCSEDLGKKSRTAPSQKHSGAHTSCYLSWLPPVEKHLDLDLWKCMKQGLKQT